tara:strand:+ start:712 stop:885 length:174 start_codon:yes stop_codon:yes gene_type:complete
MKNWIVGRMREPSTYAALGLCAIGAGVLINSVWSVWIVVAGIIIGIAAFVLKEKGIL